MAHMTLLREGPEFEILFRGACKGPREKVSRVPVGLQGKNCGDVLFIMAMLENWHFDQLPFQGKYKG